ncbi:MAG: hypothetical protein M3230_06250 [Thermoproteota archaeon]|nr:hypothetical protein [Thermoproteota archaeon]
MYISKSIVEAHTERIWAENNTDGRVAIFKVLTYAFLMTVIMIILCYIHKESSNFYRYGTELMLPHKSSSRPFVTATL